MITPWKMFMFFFSLYKNPATLYLSLSTQFCECMRYVTCFITSISDINLLQNLHFFFLLSQHFNTNSEMKQGCFRGYHHTIILGVTSGQSPMLGPVIVQVIVRVAKSMAIISMFGCPIQLGNHLIFYQMLGGSWVNIPLFPFVLVDLESLHSDSLTGVVHETMHHTFGP